MTGPRPDNLNLQDKSEVAKREEETLAFWQANKIFEKSLVSRQGSKEFVFYDGPPFATGLPHTGSLLSSVIKDVIPRYKTMRGFYVRRRWGWDTHGLPVENMIEKDLGLKSKKDIEAIGVEKFNEACRAKVLEYAHDWRKYVDRIGRWVDFDNSYKTMDATYTESVWWALKQMHEKGLLYEGRKVLMYCPHCETPLAKAEIAMDNSYKDVTEEAVTVKFKTKDFRLLAWTTTPWTLPANVALAVGPEIEYSLIEKEGEKFVVASTLVQKIFGNEVKVEKTFFGKEFEGLEYETLYEIDAVKKTGKRSHYVALADFVNTDEGTGIVHTAVIYGEDDYQLGLKNDLPMVPLLNPNGTYNNDAPEFLRGQYIKKADKLVIEDLEKRGLLFAKAANTHSYPHCYRCGTALIYNALSSWFINIQKIKARMLELNEGINWVPEHLKHGRFKHIVENAPDWTISRNRYWASPLPIWKCGVCQKIEVIGSLAQLRERTPKSGNQYFLMRHGEAESNRSSTVSVIPGDVGDVLSPEGQAQVGQSAKGLGKIDRIFHSSFNRAKETAKILAASLDVDSDRLHEDKRLGEFFAPEAEGGRWKDVWAKYPDIGERYKSPMAGGESFADARARMLAVFKDLEKTYKNERIIAVSHDLPMILLNIANESMTVEEEIKSYSKLGDSIDFENAETREFNFLPSPRDKKGEVDLHRPYIDEIKLGCECGGKMARIPEVVDCWVESGSMPFAEYHYPFENKDDFEKRFPGDFIAEYIAQTRTWFYYMLAVSTALFNKESFKNVVTTGNILAADGSKMSKSKKNYTDPLELMDKYGSDALRYSLMTSVVMQAEDVAFRDEDVKDVYQRLVNILWNTVLFFQMYAQAPSGSTAVATAVEPLGQNVLDKWILARLAELHKEVTENLDKFDTIKAGRPIRDFVTDFSTWYIRRSRDRFKSDDALDREAAISTTRFVLLELSKLIAPFMPFLAEQVYKAVGGPLASVHLEDWSDNSRFTIDESRIIEEMAVTRSIVSEGLELRSLEGIKVRQPLSKLTISTALPGEYLGLIKDEINVKKVEVVPPADPKANREISLDCVITPELKLEGDMRDLVRQIQEKRKEMGLAPGDKITTTVPQVFSDVVGKFENEIKWTTHTTEIITVTDVVDLKIEKA